MATPRRGTRTTRRRTRSTIRRTAHVLPALGGLVIAVACVGVVVDGTGAEAGSRDAAAISPSSDVIAQARSQEPAVSRSAERTSLSELPVADVKVTGHRLVLKDGTELHSGASDDSAELATLSRGDRVAVTGTTRQGWTEVVHKELPRWVESSAVAKRLPQAKKPKTDAEPKGSKAGLSAEPCPRAAGVEAGLQPDTVKVLRAVCAAFPDITTYGGTSGSGEHATGQALDVMVTGPRGDEIAAFLQEHRAELGIEYLIWQQRIWNPSTSPGWRPMEDRGSPTANHVDHVHVTTFGSAATS